MICWSAHESDAVVVVHHVTIIVVVIMNTTTTTTTKQQAPRLPISGADDAMLQRDRIVFTFALPPHGAGEWLALKRRG
jgi:hypothetical protein